MHDIEYTTSDIQKLFQQFFPQRRLVLSQFTFFNRNGVMRATGNTFKRRRRCYRLQDILSIACVIALKEQGIPLKNIEQVPALIQEKSALIFRYGSRCRLSGLGNTVALTIPGIQEDNPALQTLLTEGGNQNSFWSYDVGRLSTQLRDLFMQADDFQQAA